MGGGEGGRGDGGVSRLSVEFDFLPVPKHFVEKPFIVSKSFGYGKLLGLTGGYHVFLSKICCLVEPKSSYRNPSVFQKFLGIRREKGKREAKSQLSVGDLLSYTPEKNGREAFMCVSEILWPRKSL